MHIIQLSKIEAEFFSGLGELGYEPLSIDLLSSFSRLLYKGLNPRGFNGSVNIPESCDFRSQFGQLNIIC